MNDIDTMLRATATSLTWPATPDFRPVTAAAHRWRRPTLRPRSTLALAAAVVVVVTIAVVTPAREAVLAFFGIRGVTVEAGIPLPIESRAELGDVVDMVQAAELTGLPIGETGLLGTPAETRLDGADRVWMIFAESALTPGGAILTVFDSTKTPALTKRVVDPALQAELVTVNGEPGMWITGIDHAIFFEPSPGNAELLEGRMSDNALVWQSGPLTYRLEADIHLDAALEIAASLP